MARALPGSRELAGLCESKSSGRPVPSWFGPKGSEAFVVGDSSDLSGFMMGAGTPATGSRSLFGGREKGRGKRGPVGRRMGRNR